jgi:predicted alpha-1,6-mannanase (GH76 family)
MEMKRLWVLILMALVAVPVAANDLGDGILSGEPVDTWSGTTSNTAEVFGFYTPWAAVQASAMENSGDWTTTRTQWYADLTSQTVTRTMLFNWLNITNYTTRTVYLSLNGTRQSRISGGSRTFVNETTPTLNSTTYQFRLDPYTGSLPFQMQMDEDSHPNLFPIHNVTMYFYDADTDYFTSATMQAEITSATIVLRGR